MFQAIPSTVTMTQPSAVHGVAQSSLSHAVNSTGLSASTASLGAINHNLPTVTVTQAAQAAVNTVPTINTAHLAGTVAPQVVTQVSHANGAVISNSTPANINQLLPSKCTVRYKTSAAQN